MSTAEFYIEFKSKLKTIYDDREADNIADWIFENVTGLKKWERRNNQNELSDIYRIRLEEYLHELLQFKPVQYILNEAWFYKRKFYVNEDVLIPRPETEELVEWVVNDMRAKNIIQPEVMDVGTGSGCIAISLKAELSAASVTAIDISDKAIIIARRNAEELHCKINFLQINFLQKEDWYSLGEYDVIISNPPYIPKREKEILSKNVTDFEPDIALFVEDNDPYIFYNKIAEFAQLSLKENGKIYVEVHEEYAGHVKRIFENADFSSVIKKDIYGKERMISAEKKLFHTTY